MAHLTCAVVEQLERTLRGIGATVEGVPWQADVDVLERVRSRVEQLAYAPDALALPALDTLLEELECAGQTDFSSRMAKWLERIDGILSERR